jgi:hypothetical protein
MSTQAIKPASSPNRGYQATAQTVKFNTPVAVNPAPKISIEPIEPVIGATKVTKQSRPAEQLAAVPSKGLTTEQHQERNQRRKELVERLRGADSQIDRLLFELVLLKEKDAQCDWNRRAVIAQVETALASAYQAAAMERFVAAVVSK